LVPKPEVLLMDEPFGALDAQTREEMQELLLQINRVERTTTIFVTHDVEEAIYLSNRVLVFSPRPGTIIADVNIPFGAERTSDLKVEPAFIGLKQTVKQLLNKHGQRNRLSQLDRLTQSSVGKAKVKFI